MFVGRTRELDTIRTHLSAKPGEADAASIMVLYGLFGAGKTTLLKKIRHMVEEEHLADAIFVTNEDISASTIPEFVFQLASGFQSVNPALSRFSLDETEARRRRYLQIIGRLGPDVMPLMQQVRLGRNHAPGAPEYGGRQLDADLAALEIAIKHQFNNSDDQRLTLDPGNVMSEAFIVDMMGTFFPLPLDSHGQEGSYTGSLDGYLKGGDAPKKIVIVIDTFEKITQLLNPWLLESFLPYIYQKRFGDFQSYRTSFLPEGVYVREFFDIRIVIAGRERLSLTDYERRWDRYRETMKEMRIGAFTPDELKEYLKLSHISVNGDTDKIMQMTQGLPYLVSLWVDATTAEANGAERAFINSLAEQRIFWYKNGEQREWIRSAAFLDWFDADALQCFAPVGNDASRAYEYLRGSSEVSRPSAVKPGKFELHEIIRASLREATLQESGDKALDFSESAASFYDAYDLLDRFEPQERRLLRRLAYFAHFDDEAISRHFGGEAHLVRRLIESAPDLFVRHARTWSLERDAARKLTRYNRCADRELYDEMVEQIRHHWSERREQLNNEIARSTEGIAQAEAELRETIAEHSMRGDLHTKAQRDVNTLQSELHISKRRWNQRLSARDALVARTSFLLMVVFLLAVFFAELIPVDSITQNLIRTASLVLTLLFLTIFSLMLGRIFYIRSKRQDHQALREDIVSLEDRLLQKQYEFHDLGARSEKALSTSQALQTRIAELRARIAECQEALLESYA